MYPISRQRFDVLIGNARDPRASMMLHELGWYERDDGAVVAALVVDTDMEFSGILLARDMAERFRFVSITGFTDSAEAAHAALDQAVEQLDVSEAGPQGDEGSPVDFFRPVVGPHRLHASFARLASTASFAAARAVVGNLMRWYEDSDGNYVEQFQTTGFDARMWELYLFATLIESGYSITMPSPAPDFVAIGPRGSLAIEATSANAPGAPAEPPTTTEEREEYRRNYLPMRFSGPLTAKLLKRDWERVKGMPFVIAVQDFHAPLSMTYSGGSLQSYLYGAWIESGGGGERRVERVAEHRWGEKIVPSGFFGLPDSENVSAVLFNGAGTISKFNRIGVAAGFGDESVVLIHAGYRLDPDTTEGVVGFEDIVQVGTFESWADGGQVFHNPNARVPLDPLCLPGFAHHWFVDNEFTVTFPEGHLDSSVTHVLPAAAFKQRRTL